MPAPRPYPAAARTRRVLAALLGAVALTVAAAVTAAPSALGATATAAGTAAAAGAAAAASTPATTVDACDQDPAPGHYACFAERLTGGRAADLRAMASTGTPSGYGPASLQSAYDLPSNTAGSGQRIYVVDAYDDPNAEADLAVYRTQYGLPACTTANGCFQKLNQNGGASPLPAPNSGWSQEISLDLDMVSATCPNCGITLIEANDAGDALFTAVKQATTLGAKFVSMSWGGGEDGSELSYDAGYFASSGVVYTASTGDDAYLGGVSYPASSADVVAVGGTSLSPATNARGWSEAAWGTSSKSGAGSGCSQDEPRPSWQTPAVIATSVCPNRAVADVSAVADPATGVAVYLTYGGSGWAVYGGTSAAAPIIASTYALAGTPTATERPPSLPYGDTGALNDVTSGSTGTCSPALLCTAAPGWDGPTGLGTPDGLAAFTPPGAVQTPNTVSVTNPGTRSGTVGRATTLQIQASDSGGARLAYTATGLPGGLSVSASSGLVSGTPNRSGTYHPTVRVTDSTGVFASATFTWTIAPAPVVCAGGLISNPGFESGTTGWSMSGPLVHRSPAYAYQGTHLAKLDGTGRARHDRISRTVTIPAGCHASLHFHLWVVSNDHGRTAHDHLYLTVAGTRLRTCSNLDRSSGYRFYAFDVSAYAGKRVTISWDGYENTGLATSFLLDYVGVTLSR